MSRYQFDDVQFAIDLMEFRKEQFMSQAELSVLIGVSPSCVCQWETLKQVPTADHFLVACLMIEKPPRRYLHTNGMSDSQRRDELIMEIPF